MKQTGLEFRGRFYCSDVDPPDFDADPDPDPMDPVFKRRIRIQTISFSQLSVCSVYMCFFSIPALTPLWIRVGLRKRRGRGGCRGQRSYHISQCLWIEKKHTKKSCWIRNPDPHSMRKSGSGSRVTKTCGFMRIRIRIRMNHWLLGNTLWFFFCQILIWCQWKEGHTNKRRKCNFVY